MYTQKYVRTQGNICIHAKICTYVHHINMHVHNHMHALTQTYTHHNYMYTHKHIHSRKNVYVRKYIQTTLTCVRTRKNIHTTLTCTYAQEYSCTHTSICTSQLHTHSHTNINTKRNLRKLDRYTDGWYCGITWSSNQLAHCVSRPKFWRRLRNLWWKARL